MKKENEIPHSVAKIVGAVCLDYKRRKSMIERGCVNGRTKDEYKRLNEILESTLVEECEVGVRKYMLEDIAINRGYRKTPMYYISQSTYYERKRRVKYAIAKKLNLVE